MMQVKQLLLQGINQSLTLSYDCPFIIYTCFNAIAILPTVTIR